jgi:hypothetical protein
VLLPSTKLIMRQLLSILLLLGLLLQRAAAQQLVPTDTVATRYQLPGADCALFPAGANMNGMFIHPKHAQRFTPTKEQVVAIEKDLLPAQMRFLAANQPTNATVYEHKCRLRISKTLVKYRRQYVGFYNERQQPCLYINCFPINKLFPSWLRQLVEVEDGGASFWHIYFNLTTKQFFSFSHNSSA